jgi:HSP20 family protein
MPETLPARISSSFPSLFNRAPFRTLRQEMDDLIERVSREWDGNWPAVGFRPAADVSETDGTLEIKMDIPGVKPEEVSIEVTGNRIRISGERKTEKEEKGKTWHRVQRSSGQFCETMTLPCAIKEDQVHAEFHDGVLVVKLPKTEAAKTHKVKIKANGTERAAAKK